MFNKIVYFAVSPFFKIGVLLWKLASLIAVVALILPVSTLFFVFISIALVMDTILLCFTTKPPSKPGVNFKNIYDDTIDFWSSLTNNL